MRAILFIIILIAPTFIGLWQSRLIKLRRRQLECFQQLFDEFRIEIKYNCKSVSEILESAVADKRFSELKLTAADAATAGNAAKYALESKNLYIKRDERALISEFFTGLGQTDVSGQLTRCDYYSDKLADVSERTEKKDRDNAKLFPILGVFAGVFMIIMIV